MIKKNLLLCIGVALLLSGCGSVRQNEDNVQVTASKNESISNTHSNEKVENVERKVEFQSPSESKQTEKITPSSESVNTKKAFIPSVSSGGSTLSTKAMSWSWLYSSKNNANLLSKYNGYGFGDTSSKVIYLTFDEGYENGYTSSILDTLKANNVQATFL